MLRILIKKLFLSTSFISLLAGASFPAWAMDEEEISVASKVLPCKTQNEINGIVISTATKVYEDINKNWRYVAPEAQMHTDSKMWEPQWIMGESIVEGKRQKTKIPTLVLKASPEKLMEALEELIKKPASLECTIALTTAKIFSLREILGEKYFNLYAVSFYKLLETTEGWTAEQFFHELPLQFLKSKEGTAIPGSITYITNIPQYGEFKPTGNGRGSNVFSVAKNQYLGFSAIYKTGPQSLEIIESQDLALFVKKEDVEKDNEKHEKISQMLTSNKDLFIQARRNAQKKVDFYQFFDLQEINEFIKTGEIFI